MLRPTPSAAEKPQFREINGEEAAVIVANRMRDAIYERLKASGVFDMSNAYPVAMIQYQIRIKCMPGEKDPPASFVTGEFKTDPEEFDKANAVENAIALMDEVMPVAEIPMGISVDNAPDKLREENDLPVVQPVKEASGRVRNRPVNAPVKGK
jgi:hypothetical protein